MTRSVNTPYWRELKDKIIDYVVKLNLEYIKFQDVSHIVNRSEFIRLCKSGFFIKKRLHKKQDISYWQICECEKPVIIKEIKFKR